jgi:hypothetical protein
MLHHPIWCLFTEAISAFFRKPCWELLTTWTFYFVSDVVIPGTVLSVQHSTKQRHENSRGVTYNYFLCLTTTVQTGRTVNICALIAKHEDNSIHGLCNVCLLMNVHRLSQTRQPAINVVENYSYTSY